MYSIHKQKIEKQDFSIFLRDLSETLNVNLKHMIEDNCKDDIVQKSNKKDYQKKKKKKIVVKKKDLIIQEQNKKREKKMIEDDLNKIDFLFKTINFNEPFIPLKELKTKEGKLAWKVKLLEYFWNHKKKYIHFIILIYYEIRESNHPLLEKIQNIMMNYDTKLFMMKELGHLLPPLNHWNQVKNLDEWQIKTIKHIKNKENTIVKAPTSSGKSFIAMAAGILHQKVLYICPAKPVAYQIGAHFTHMGYKVHFLVENLSHYSYDSKTNIFIGTPKEVENNILKIGTNFDYVVYDEIHNLNKKEDGDSYENLIKILNCNFIALSATIQNIEDLQSFFQNVNGEKIHLIEYNKRFINHQRWIWKDKLIKLHPFCAYNSITDIKNNNLSFTPNDCATLWECIDDIFDDNDIIDGCSPDDFFKVDKLLNLDDCKEYENFIKNKLFEWNKSFPNEIKEILDSFQEGHISENKNDLIDFIKQVKNNEMFPMLMFHTNENVCRDIFYNLYDYLNKKELEEYPYHYEILEKKQELYQSYLDKRSTYKDGIKITSSNAEYEIKDKLITFDKKEKNNYISIMNQYYNQKINDIKRSEIEDKIKKKQIKNLKREYNHFIENPDLNYHDIFKKHKDFVFTYSNEPMSADTIRNVRREIKKTLGIKIPYESPLFQLLKRGIGLYIENMPDEYNWILQKLLSKKEIGVVISDKTLCMGIDLPVRTSCFLGIDNPNFTNDDYLQMSGRAGRRGLDNQGNIVFYGSIDYVQLMNQDLPKLQGNSNPIYDNYKIIDNPRIFNNMINPNRKIIEVENVNKCFNEKKLLWYLRNYQKSAFFINELYQFEKKLFMETENERPLMVLNKISDLIDKGDIVNEYKFKKINNKDNINLIKEHINVLMYIHNNLHPQKFLIIVKNIKIIFSILNQILFNHII